MVKINKTLAIATLAISPIISACHHLQLARNPLPVSLHDDGQTLIISGKNAIVLQTDAPEGKSKPSKKSVPKQPVYLLENWF